MMPEVSQVHIDTALTNVSVAYRNRDYIADDVAPPIAVRKQSDKYFVYDPEREFMRATPDARAPGAEANEVDFALSTDSYFCEDHALEAAIPDEERENADPPLQPDVDRAELLADKIALNREIALHTLLSTGTGINTHSLDPLEWWSLPDSDPLAHLRAAANVVFSSVQRRPNVAVFPYAVFDVLRNHPRIVERLGGRHLAVLRFQHPGTGVGDRNQLAQPGHVAGLGHVQLVQHHDVGKFELLGQQLLDHGR